MCVVPSAAARDESAHLAWRLLFGAACVNKENAVCATDGGFVCFIIDLLTVPTLMIL